MRALIQILNIFQNRLLQHGLFWLLSAYILLRIFAYDAILDNTNVLYTIFFHISLAILVYVNLYISIPNLLRKNKILQFILFSVFLVLACTLLNFWTFDYIIDFLLPGYYFISYYDFIDIVQFMLTYFVASTLFKLSKSWFQLRRTERQLNILKEQKISVELEALKAKVNPHFLLNSLNSIYSLALDDEKDKLQESIMKLSSSMKYVLYETVDQRVALGKELKYINDYIQLQRIRMDYPKQVNFNIKGYHDHLKIAPFMLIPLIENAFKHGLKGDKEENFINLDIQIEGEELLLIVSNNNSSYNSNTIYKKGGFGIDNLKKRLTIEYPNKHSLQIKASKDNYYTSLKLDLS